MIRKKKVCSSCGKEEFLFSKGRCKRCTPVKKIGTISKSHKETVSEYTPLMRKFLEENPMCQVKTDECTKFAQGVHHKKGKATRELYLDTSLWMASCNRCNVLIEEMGDLAYELGLKIRRNQI